MSVKSVKKEKGNATIVIEATKEQFDNAINTAFKKAKKNIFVPGFRKGHAPRQVIEGMYGKSVFYEDAVNEIFPELYGDAVKSKKLKVVGSPSLSDMDVAEDGTLVLTVVTALYPTVKLGEYKGLEVPKTPVTVTEAEIDAEVDRMAQNASRIVTVEREAQMGDSVVFDFEGFVDGKPFEGGKAENYTLKLGSGQFIPGFEEALVGAKAGEDRDVNVTFPEQYDKKLAGKDATFKCRIHEVKETIVPEKDDEFVKDVSEFDTMAELRKDIKARFKKEREQQAQTQFENDAVEAAAEQMKCDIPACMIDEQVDRHMEQFAYQLQMNGMKFEDYMKMTGGNMEALRANMRPMAEKTVKSNILLSEIVTIEKIEITAEEIEEEYGKLAEQYGMEVDRVKAAIDEAAVRSDLEARKAVKIIADSAKAVAPKKTAEKKPAAKKPEEKPAAAKKPAAKKSEAKPAAEKKPAAKKPAAKKTEEKPAAEKKPAAKKPAAKKPAAKKPAAKKNEE
ncbi:MAG: trigger factor [Oscillospiraceae bacterium]|nr:trigger factor [Oscillospiraceae bacterium]